MKRPKLLHVNVAVRAEALDGTEDARSGYIRFEEHEDDDICERRPVPVFVLLHKNAQKLASVN